MKDSVNTQINRQICKEMKYNENRGINRYVKEMKYSANTVQTQE